MAGRIVFTESAMDPIKSLCKKSYHNLITGLFISGRLDFIGRFWADSLYDAKSQTNPEL